jgi:hypothetical protein
MPIVLDASTVIGDCLRLSQGKNALLLFLAREMQVSNLYATQSVREEVEEHLREAALRGGFDPEAALSAWQEQFAPLIGFVDISSASLSDPRSVALAARDADDAPTASLAELLAPCLVFSNDSDLVDSGIAHRNWGEMMVYALEVGNMHAGVTAVLFLVMLSGAGIYGLTETAFRRLPRSALIGLLGAGGAFGAGYWRSELGVRHRSNLASVVHRVNEKLLPFLQRVNECSDLLEQAAFVPDGQPTDVARVARAVAVAPFPLRPAEISADIGLSTQKVAFLLRDPIFRRSADSHYGLGARAVGGATSR